MKKPRTSLESSRCRHTCAGANNCCCRNDVAHSWHICSDPQCKCHEVAWQEVRYVQEPSEHNKRMGAQS